MTTATIKQDLAPAIAEALAAIKPASMAASAPGTVSDFQRETLEVAKALGFKVAKAGQTWTLTLGEVKVTVIHSEKGYVRKVTYSGLPAGLKVLAIIPNQAKKWLTLLGSLQVIHLALQPKG